MISIRAGRILSSILAVFAVLLFAQPMHAQTSNKLKIGFSIDSMKPDRWQTDFDAFQTTAQRLGGEVIMKDADGDDDVQFQQVKEMIQAGIKVLVIVPHDTSRASRIVDVARAANVRVISYDRMVLNSDVDLFVGFDPYEIGRMQAEYIVKLAPKGNYVLLAGAPSDDNAKILCTEQKKILQPYIDRGDIKVVAEAYNRDWTPTEAYLHMTEAIESSKGMIDVVLSSNDRMAGAAIQALQEHNLSKVLVTGQDADLAAIIRILDGTQSMTIYKSVSKEGARAAEEAVKLAKGEKIETDKTMDNGRKKVPAIMLKLSVVTKENVKSTVIKDGFQKLESIQQALPKEKWPRD
jgi:D-xylose transport system substrate-binding protein